MILKKILALLCLMLSVLSACPARAEAQLSDDYLSALESERYAVPSLYEQTGFQRIAVTPDAFATLTGEAIGSEDSARHPVTFFDMLRLVGFPDIPVHEQLRAPVTPTGVDTYVYGDIPAAGGAQQLNVVLVTMQSYRIATVFLSDADGWWLTDCLIMSDYGIENQTILPLLTRDDGAPGGWLLTQQVGHGTGLYMRKESWYNVLTRRYEVSYIREGFEELSRDAQGLLYSALWTDISIPSGRLPAVLPFTTWTSLVREPIVDGTLTRGMTQQLDSRIITGQFAYDAASCSYRLQNRTLHDDPRAVSPATEVFGSLF